MKLLLVSIEFPPGPGGIGKVAYQVARGLHEQGWGVRVATVQAHASSSEIESFNAAQPFPVHRFAFKGPRLLEGLERWFALRGLVRRERPDVLLAVGRQSIWLAAVLSRQARIPLVVAGAGSEFIAASWFERRLTRWALARAGLVLPISAYTAGLAEQQGVPRSRMQIIPCGADSSIFRPGLPVEGLRRRLKLEGAQVILTVGQVSRRKAQDVIVRALPAILERCPRAIYLVAGLPAEQAGLERLAQELHVAEHVLFAGVVPQTDLPLYYNLAQVFALVSRPVPGGEVEGFGIAAVEAALSGLPAVVSSHGGLVEAVRPGETALVVPPNDPAATSAAILRLLQNRELREQMGRSARRYALANAAWEPRIRAYDQALKQLLGE